MKGKNVTDDDRRRFLGAIVVLRTERGIPPTLREVGNFCQRSSSAVYEHLRNMRDQGLVDWKDGADRTLVVTKKGEEFLASQ